MDDAVTAECFECGETVEVVARRDDGVHRFAIHDCPGAYASVHDRVAYDQKLESRFTSPRPDCPHPERWHSADMDSAEWEVTNLVAALVGALQPDVVVETGSAWGQTAYKIGAQLSLNKVGTLYTLEPEPTRAEATRRRCKDLPVEVEEMKSLDWEPVDGIGFAWFDSLPELRVPEFRAYRPHMTSHAVVGFHDTGPHFGSLRADIEALEDEGLLVAIHLPTPRGVTFAETAGDA